MQEVPVEHKARPLTDNGSGYLSKPSNEYLEQVKMKHILPGRLHPHTADKFERLNRIAKERLNLVTCSPPEELQPTVRQFAHWINSQRYHEALGNLCPVAV